MAKKCSISLEFKPKHIDMYADYFLLSYEKPSPLVEIFEKSGEKFSKINI